MYTSLISISCPAIVKVWSILAISPVLAISSLSSRIGTDSCARVSPKSASLYSPSFTSSVIWSGSELNSPPHCNTSYPSVVPVGTSLAFQPEPSRLLTGVSPLPVSCRKFTRALCFVLFCSEYNIMIPLRSAAIPSTVSINPFCWAVTPLMCCTSPASIAENTVVLSVAITWYLSKSPALWTIAGGV
ncbi:hypothetical protein D3C75_737480 [compost metagenome]